MQKAAKVRFFCVTAACVSLMMLCAGPQLLWILYVVPVFSSNVNRHRDRLFNWQTFWSAFLLDIFTRGMKINIEFDIPDSSRNENAIIVANHRSWLDIFLVAGPLHRMELKRLTAVVKKEIRKVPVLGRFAAAIQCAFITRNNTGFDIARIRECAWDSRNSNASVIIFPEGTRFRKNSPRRKGFESVLSPKSGGLRTLLEELPDFRLLAVTVQWPQDVKVRTILDGAALYGKTLVIRTAEIDRSNGAKHSSEIINAVWQEMDLKMSHR